MKYPFFLILAILFFQNCSSKNKTIQASKEVSTQKEVNTFEEIEAVVKDFEVEIKQPYVRPKRYDFSYYQDADKLIKEMTNPQSDIFLDSILYKFQNLKTLTPKQKITLLLAGTKMKGYRDKRLISLNEEIEILLKEKKYKEAIQKSNECISIFPLSVEGFIGKFEAYASLEEDELSDEFYGKLNMIFTGMQKSGRMDNINQPYIALSKAAIEGYTSLYAGGASYRLLDQTKDEKGNDLFKYKCMGSDEYFVIPKK